MIDYKKKMLEEIASFKEIDTMLRRHSIKFNNIGSIEEMEKSISDIHLLRNKLNSTMKTKCDLYRKLKRG